MCCDRIKSEDGASIVCKASASAIRRTLRPQSKGMKPGTPADRAPRRPVVSLHFASLMDERQKQFAVRRQIAFFRIDASLQPGARIERIILRVPADDMKPVRRTPTEDDGFMGFTGKYHKQTRGDFLVSHMCTRRQRSTPICYDVDPAAEAVSNWHRIVNTAKRWCGQGLLPDKLAARRVTWELGCAFKTRSKLGRVRPSWNTTPSGLKATLPKPPSSVCHLYDRATMP